MPLAAPPAHPSTSAPVHRIEVRLLDSIPDPTADSLRRELDAALPRAADPHPSSSLPRGVRTAKIYLLEAQLTDAQLRRIASALLADSLTERAALSHPEPLPPGWHALEVHPLPGVMDPAAQSVERAVHEMLATPVRVSTGWRYEIQGLSRHLADSVAARLLANPAVHRVVHGTWHPDHFPRAHAAPPSPSVRRINIRDLDDARLAALSREAHLFLSLDEMRAIRDEYRCLGREPSDIELETLAQTWSEHCVHKTLKSTVHYRETPTPGSHTIDFSNRPGVELHPDSSVTIHNLLKSTIARATHHLIESGLDWTLSVFKDNSGVIAFDDSTAVCIKVETHNHPSAIEPYGGAATGAGGCIRDVIATGLGAKPIASTDVFCVAFPDHWAESADSLPPSPASSGIAAELRGILPSGVIHPARTLRRVVAGVRDYGNRMGIPTLSGAVSFDDRYVGNPLVFCGCIGTMPRNRTHGRAHAGDCIVALGGRTGRDGIHGATFSSAELEHTSADEFSHAVQIGNAIEEKRLLDAILRARDDFPEPLYHALTDCGAGGFSSAVGEMGASLGATVHLDRAPLKYEGLTYTEIWISEAQERIVLAVPPQSLNRLRAICDEESVEMTVLGAFATPNRELFLCYHDLEVGRMSMDFLHDGIPTPIRTASWPPPASTPSPALTDAPFSSSFASSAPTVRPADALLQLLAHPEIASKHWLVRQYDHEVQGNTALKPLVGPGGFGPGDAAVITPVPDSTRALAISQGLATGIANPLPPALGDPYVMAWAAIDECVRNLVCVGSDPDRIAILDNFCWPSCQREHNLGALVRACLGCHDAALAYRTPFVSGKDSLNNQLTVPLDPGPGSRTIEIPYTLLITGIAIVPDLARCVTSDAKSPANLILLLDGSPSSAPSFAGSRFHQLFPDSRDPACALPIPRTDPHRGPAAARAVHAAISAGLVRSAHDVSDGGMLVALAEMLIASAPDATARGSLGAVLFAPLASAPAAPTSPAAPSSSPSLADLFHEAPSRYLLEVRETDAPAVIALAVSRGISCSPIARLDSSARLSAHPDAGFSLDIPVAELLRAWRAPLDG